MKNRIGSKKSQTFLFFFSLLTILCAGSYKLEGKDCLTVASPYDFYYNTVLLSWTPISGSNHYLIEYMIGTSNGTVKLMDHWLLITAVDRFQWETFVSAGAIKYRITARDLADNVIEGPTDWAEFRCYLYKFQDTQPKNIKSTYNSVDPECLSICNPPQFIYNTILLSWTPITGADHYKLNFCVLEKQLSIETEYNWFRMVADNPSHWDFLVNLASIAFNVEVYDYNGNLFAGPTEWSLFIKN